MTSKHFFLSKFHKGGINNLSKFDEPDFINMDSIYIITIILIIAAFIISKKLIKPKKGYSFTSENDPIKPLKSKNELNTVDKEGNFELKSIKQNELKFVKIDDNLSLWTKPDLNYINVYRRGCAGGEGLIGQVPNNLFHRLSDYLNFGGRVEAKIVDIKNNFCKIEYKIITREEVKIENHNYWTKRKEELQKPYNPRNDDTNYLYIEKGIKIRKGDKLHIDFEEKNYYLKNIRKLKLNLINNKTNRIIGKLEDGHAVKPLKAYFNGYDLDISVLEKKAELLTINIKFIK